MNKFLFFIILFSTYSISFAEIQLDSPKGGWHIEDSSAKYVQEVHYPASRVNSLGDVEEAIKGKILNHPKNSTKPATLVVNGVAMPQEINSDGSFSRPYSFGIGSNSIELITQNGERKRVQFYDNNPNKTRPKLRIVLGWDTPDTDLDLHIVTPDGEHCYYGDRILKNGGALDIDVTTGYGPEIFSLPSSIPGIYLIYINYFGGYNREEKVVTNATITVITNESTVNEKKQTFKIPMREPGELNLVKTLQIN